MSVTSWTSSACVAHECVTCVHHEPACFCPSLVKSKPWIMDASLGTQIWINSVLLLHNYWQNHHTKHKNRRYLHIFCVLYIQAYGGSSSFHSQIQFSEFGIKSEEEKSKSKPKFLFCYLLSFPLNKMHFEKAIITSSFYGDLICILVWYSILVLILSLLWFCSGTAFPSILLLSWAHQSHFL